MCDYLQHRDYSCKLPSVYFIKNNQTWDTNLSSISTTKYVFMRMVYICCEKLINKQSEIITLFDTPLHGAPLCCMLYPLCRHRLKLSLSYS